MKCRFDDLLYFQLVVMYTGRLTRLDCQAVFAPLGALSARYTPVATLPSGATLAERPRADDPQMGGAAGSGAVRAVLVIRVEGGHLVRAVVCGFQPSRE